MRCPVERVFRPTRSYWFAYEVVVSSCALMIGGFAFLTQLEGSPAEFHWRPSVALWCLLAAGIVYLAAAAVYALLVYRREQLVIRDDEVRSHGPLFVRAIRFADVIEVRWLWRNDRRHPSGLRLRTATKKLVVYFSHFVQRETQGELLDLFRNRLRRCVCQDWETFQAVREGRASPWSPPVFTVMKMSRMLAVVTVIALVFGAAIGFLIQMRSPGVAAWWASAASNGEIDAALKIPGTVKWPWSGSLPLDWSLGFGLAGLVAGILFLNFFRCLEWAGLRWLRIVEGRRLERAMPPAPGLFQPPPDLRGGYNSR